MLSLVLHAARMRLESWSGTHILLLRCNVAGVTRRWILGALEWVLPFLDLTSRRYVLTYWRTSSSCAGTNGQ